MTLTKLSIIIPLGPDEDQLNDLLDDLCILPEGAEVILVTCHGDTAQHEAMVKNTSSKAQLRLITAPQGRALQQNAGAKAASHEFLWFLHADSRVTHDALIALETALKTAPDALHYFHLKFKKDGPKSMLINEWGAWFRSQFLGIPFGDQGFCLRRRCFEKIGMFPEDAPYGEDHLLVWHARQFGIKLRCTGAALITSARKYQDYGWGALTLKYQYLWIKQALPELRKLIIRS